MLMPGSSIGLLGSVDKISQPRFRDGERSPNGPRPDQSWRDDARYGYVIVHENDRYPVKEIIRLAVHATTGGLAG